MSKGICIAALDVERRSFKELSGVTSLDSVSKLTKDNLLDMVREYPLAMTELIVDLIMALEQANGRP